MKRGNWPSFDASDEDPIGVVLMTFDKISRRLLCWNGNKRDSLVSRLEPDNLRLVLLFLVSTRVSVAVLAFSFLFFLRSLTTRTKKAERSVDS